MVSLFLVYAHLCLDAVRADTLYGISADKPDICALEPCPYSGCLHFR